VGQKTGIAWTDHTFNAWWGCTKIEAPKQPDALPSACDFCYAAEMAERGDHGVWGKDAPRRFFGDAHWNEPRRWNKAAKKDGKQRLVFCGSMMDYLEDRRDLDEQRVRLAELVRDCDALDWQMLTKRPGKWHLMPDWFYKLPNVWSGTTIEGRDTLWRADKLREHPASIRFLSCEPLFSSLVPGLNLEGLHWVITGGESGTHLNPRTGPGLKLIDERALVVNVDGRWTPNPEREEWIRDIDALCRMHDVAHFFKQWGGPLPKSGGHMLDGKEVRLFPRGDELRAAQAALL
jgi:protein gp37